MGAPGHPVQRRDAPRPRRARGRAAVGRLTGKDSGKGRLPDPGELFALAERVLASNGNHAVVREREKGLVFAGRKVLVSAGGTREELDPVRFLGNWSTGRQGYAFARSAVAQGADVTLVAANVELPDPAGVKVVNVVSATDMHAAMLAEAPQADVIVMTAAVADFRPAARADQKIKKDGTLPPPIELAENPDILADLARRRKEHGRGGQVIVGFAAETNPDLDAARAKLARKGCDLLVMNQVGNGVGFGAGDNEWLVLDTDGAVTGIPRRSKDALADDILALINARLA